jgi:hypothetical protein
MARSNTVSIVVGSTNWEQKAKKTIDGKKRFKLVVQGQQAHTGGEAIRRNTSGVSGIIGVDDVALTAAIVVGVIAVVGMGVVAAVCLYGMGLGYKINATHEVNGPNPFDDKLIFDLQPPANP